MNRASRRPPFRPHGRIPQHRGRVKRILKERRPGGCVLNCGCSCVLPLANSFSKDFGQRAPKFQVCGRNSVGRSWAYRPLMIYLSYRTGKGRRRPVGTGDAGTRGLGLSQQVVLIYRADFIADASTEIPNRVAVRHGMNFKNNPWSASGDEVPSASNYFQFRAFDIAFDCIGMREFAHKVIERITLQTHV